MRYRAETEISSNDGKGNRVIIVNDEIQEAWIGSSGSFDSSAILRSVGVPVAKLPSADRKQILDESYRLWKYDPLGGSIVRTTTFFTLGRGIVFQFDDPNAQFYAKKFYKKNNLEMKLRAASDESTAFGEVYIWLRPKFTEIRKDGKILWRLGDTQTTFIPPENISYIETADEDVGDVHNFVMEWQDADMQEHYDIIPHISKYDIEGSKKEIGCIIQLKINAGNMDAFGHSDLISIKEWLDNYQEYLRDGVIINKLYRSPCYDISIEDGTEEEINAAVARYRGWSIGSNPVHNSREKWAVLEFTGPNSSNEEARRALLLIVAAGVGFAEFMLADGSNSNLASSKSQQLPVIKKFEDRQDIWSYIIQNIFQFALTAKAIINERSGLQIEYDREGDPVEFKGTIEFPSISKDRDLEVAQTNKIALENRYMSNRTAAARLNLDYDRELEKQRNDIKNLEEINDMEIKAGLRIDITEPPPGSNDQSGKPDMRSKRDRSSERGGSNSTL